MEHGSLIQAHATALSSFIVVYSVSILIVSIDSADKCIHLYPDHTIDYISNNANDPFVYYLGDKTTTTDCQDSCISLNYLCDKSTNNVFHYTSSEDTSDWQFNNAVCSVTSEHSGNDAAFALLTSDITSHEYIIEAEITVRSGDEGGIIFKTQQRSTFEYNYWIMLSMSSDTIYIGYDTANGGWKEIQHPSATLQYNHKYTLRIHVIGNTFTTYLDGVQKGNQVVIDDTKWTGNYAGLYTYNCEAVYHSFKVIYPDASDNECAAYVYNKDNGSCYGYYGGSTLQLESEISTDVGIVYDSPTCPPISSTSHPTQSSLITAEPTTIHVTSSLETGRDTAAHPLPSTIASTSHPTDINTKIDDDEIKFLKTPKTIDRITALIIIISVLLCVVVNAIFVCCLCCKIGVKLDDDLTMINIKRVDDKPGSVVNIICNETRGVDDGIHETARSSVEVDGAVNPYALQRILSAINQCEANPNIGNEEFIIVDGMGTFR